MIGSEYEQYPPAAVDEIDQLELRVFNRNVIIAGLLLIIAVMAWSWPAA